MPFYPGEMLTADSLNREINKLYDEINGLKQKTASEMALINNNNPGGHATITYYFDPSTQTNSVTQGTNTVTITGGNFAGNKEIAIEPNAWKLRIGDLILADLTTGKIITMPEDLDEASKQFWTHITTKCNYYLNLLVTAKTAEHRNDLAKARLEIDLNKQSHRQEVKELLETIKNKDQEIAELKDKLSRNRFTRME